MSVLRPQLLAHVRHVNRNLFGRPTYVSRRVHDVPLRVRLDNGLGVVANLLQVRVFWPGTDWGLSGIELGAGTRKNALRRTNPRDFLSTHLEIRFSNVHEASLTQAFGLDLVSHDGERPLD